MTSKWQTLPWLRSVPGSFHYNGIDAARDTGRATPTSLSPPTLLSTAGIAATLVRNDVIGDLVQFTALSPAGSSVQDVGGLPMFSRGISSVLPILVTLCGGLGHNVTFGKRTEMAGYKSAPLRKLPFNGGRHTQKHSSLLAKDTRRQAGDIASVIGGKPNMRKALRSPSRTRSNHLRRMRTVSEDYVPARPRAAIIAAHNRLVTAENFMAYKNNTRHLPQKWQDLCSFRSRMLTKMTWIRAIRKNAGPPAEVEIVDTCGLTKATTPWSPRRHGFRVEMTQLWSKRRR